MAFRECKRCVNVAAFRQGKSQTGCQKHLDLWSWAANKREA